MKIHAYLNFAGHAEEACRFYADVLGGTLTDIHRFGSMPPNDEFQLTDEQKNMVMHVGVQLPDGQMIMASDMLEGVGPPRIQGTTVSLSVHPTSRDEADRIFSGLAEGGTVTMPMEDQFWGDYYGAVTDRFGMHWMVNHNEANT
jgi:PhnB protein